MARPSGRSSRNGKDKSDTVLKGKRGAAGFWEEGRSGVFMVPEGMNSKYRFVAGRSNVFGFFQDKSSVYKVLENKDGRLTVFEGESGTARVVEDKGGTVRSVEVEVEVAVSKMIEAAEQPVRVERPGQHVRRLRSRRDLLELDIRRELKQYRREGLSEREIAAMVEVSQPTVHKMLEVAAKDPEPLEGFKGATPLEICQRYDAGEFGREELVDQLVRFPYANDAATDGYDWMAADPPGSWSEISVAIERGLIDESVYEDVFNRLHGL